MLSEPVVWFVAIFTGESDGVSEIDFYYVREKYQFIISLEYIFFSFLRGVRVELYY